MNNGPDGEDHFQAVPAAGVGRAYGWQALPFGTARCPELGDLDATVLTKR